MAEQQAVQGQENSFEQGIEEMHENISALKSESTDDEEVILTDSDETDDHDEEAQYTEIELAAMDKGWNPDKDSLPDGKEFISAGEFLRNEKFFAEIRKLKRDLNSQKTAFDALTEHHRKVAKVERENALEELKKQKKRALEEDDHDSVIDIDDKILELKNTDLDAESPAATTSNPEFDDWVENNSWYETDEELREMADELGEAHFIRHQGKISNTEVYNYVTKRMKTMFPEKFAEPTKQPTKRKKAVDSAVESSQGGRANTRNNKPKYSAKDLTEDQRRVMRTFVKQGALTEEEYINELVQIGELG